MATKKKKAAKKTAKPSNNWMEKDEPIVAEGKAKAKAKAASKKTPKKKTPAKDEGETTENIPVPHKYREMYKEHGGSCGDNVAEILKKQLEDPTITLNTVGKANGIDVDERWGHLNNGMKRMNLGNMLRGKIKKGESVKIGFKTIKGDK